MSVVRSLLFALYQLVVTPVYAMLVLLLSWLPPIQRFKVILGWLWLMMFGARWLCGIRQRVIGREHVPPFDQPHIVMCKHSSTWETFALNFVCPPLAFVAKKELLSIPFFGWAFRQASPITIDRKSGSDAMTQISTQGRERLRQGFWIVMYPEGTRIPAGKRAHYKTGGARLAIALGVPILPVAHNAGYLWPKGFLGKRSGTVTMSIGVPISSDGKDLQSLTNEVESWIENEVASLGNPLQASGRPHR